jgi:hypothetical protein
MASSLETFFSAWSQVDADERKATITSAIADTFCYSDPRSGGRLTTRDAVADYVGQFSANAPGWTATVEKADEINGFARAIVAFGGAGPDGSQMVQHGTYFADSDATGKLTLLVGFVGTGA